MLFLSFIHHVVVVAYNIYMLLYTLIMQSIKNRTVYFDWYVNGISFMMDIDRSI